MKVTECDFQHVLSHCLKFQHVQQKQHYHRPAFEFSIPDLFFDFRLFSKVDSLSGGFTLLFFFFLPVPFCEPDSLTLASRDPLLAGDIRLSIDDPGDIVPFDDTDEREDGEGISCDLRWSCG